jgi:hypothetical protein
MRDRGRGKHCGNAAALDVHGEMSEIVVTTAVYGVVIVVMVVFAFTIVATGWSSAPSSAGRDGACAACLKGVLVDHRATSI